MPPVFLRAPMLKKLRSSLLKALFLIGLMVSVVCYLNLRYPLNLNRFYQHSSLLYDKDNQLLSVKLSVDGYWRLPAHLKKIDPLFIKMLIFFEDKRFYSHPGIDPLAMLRALFQGIRAGHIVSGASTITLQTVRLLESRPRTVKSKIIECFRALQLELSFSKEEILEIYLSLTPYGGNLEGLRSASLCYFAKEPLHLRLSEAALLVAMPQHPNHLRPDLYPIKAKQARDKVLHRLQQSTFLPEKKIKEALEDSVPTQKNAFPRYANHLLNNTRAPTLLNRSCLARNLQIQLENLLKQELPFLEKTQTIAVLVVENKTKAIRSYIGNADFFDEARKGQVNMIESIRSPGSTLKPFIYGMAFEEGILQPDTILEDVPTLYGNYAPSNFKDVFHGDVTAKEALQQSLNIPAISILEKIQPSRFAAYLANFNIPLKFQDKHTQASLPIALGGVGLSFKQLMSLYVMLANEGQFSELKLMQPNANEKKEQDIFFLSRMAAQQVTSILEEAPPPDGMIPGNVANGPVIAYKTGTSFGFRDAWAIGYTKEFTVGVWVGKPDGSPSFNQTGRQNAAPLLFKIMRLLPFSKNNLTTIIEGPKQTLKFKREKTSNPFFLQFPKDGMVINASQSKEDFQSITLLLSGGKQPFYLFVNGKPIQKYDGHSMAWKPTAFGFHELLILDSEGNSSNATIELIP